MKRKNLILILTAVSIFIGALMTVYAEGGSASDPLISLSYLETRLASLKEDILKTIGSNAGSVPSGSGPTYTAIMLNSGQTLTALSGGIEILTRRGNFITVDPVGDGIVNLTSGNELKNGEALALQNLYMIPRSDGRGIKALSDECWVMVRGNYEVK